MSKTQRTNRFAMAAFAGLFALIPTFAHAATPNHADSKFVKDAAAGGMEEVELGKLAVAKASSPEVKNFGQKMVDDHSKANDQLSQLASQKGIDLKKDESMMAKHDSAKLAKLKGAKFDKAYMDMMVKDHKKDVADFEHASKGAKDNDIKSWASTTLPTLQEHWKMAKDIDAKVGGKKSK
jgi:putative membrane protein